MNWRMAVSMLAASLALMACGGSPAGTRAAAKAPAPEDPRIQAAVRAMAALPPDVAEQTEAAVRAGPDRFFALLDAALTESIAAGGLLVPVDKERPLPPGFAPDDLVSLGGYPLSVSRNDLRLRKAIMGAVLAIDEAARKDGMTLQFSSAYRSFDYQAGLFSRYSDQYGEAEASRFSARPGMSQHQLGTAIDFGSIDDSFAATGAGTWLAANAGRFGFSLSYPAGAEAVTGYVWESWHFRYITVPGAELESGYFGGIQRHFLDFVAAWAP